MVKFQKCYFFEIDFLYSTLLMYSHIHVHTWICFHVYIDAHTPHTAEKKKKVAKLLGGGFLRIATGLERPGIRSSCRQEVCYDHADRREELRRSLKVPCEEGEGSLCYRKWVQGQETITLEWRTACFVVPDWVRCLEGSSDISRKATSGGGMME